MSQITGTWQETIFSSQGDFTAVASTNAEAGLLQGTSLIPKLPAGFFTTNGAANRLLVFKAAGVFGTTGTPTLTFQARLGTSNSPTSYAGASVAVSGAITSQSAVSNKFWAMELMMMCKTAGQGSNATTVICSGEVWSFGGFASPFRYTMEPSTPDTATWTATIDGDSNAYLNLSMTWSASSASNTITVKQAALFGCN